MIKTKQKQNRRERNAVDSGHYDLPATLNGSAQTLLGLIKELRSSCWGSCSHVHACANQVPHSSIKILFIIWDMHEQKMLTGFPQVSSGEKDC